MASDLRDILDIEKKENGSVLSPLAKEPEKAKPKAKVFKRPAGMHRELYALLYNDNNDKPPMMPTLPSYQTAKAKLGSKSVKPWKWVPFTNPGRSDGAVFHHWRRDEDIGKEYPFAKFNKKVVVPVYSEEEYVQHLSVNTDWTKEETDHLLDLAKKFDRRWHIMLDRFDHTINSIKKERTLEELKERYYQVSNSVGKARAAEGETFEEFKFDADHERRRKEQLGRLFQRTKDQVKDESILINELRKMEVRKKDQKKKTHDFQKLLSFDPSSETPGRKVERRKRKFPIAGYKVSEASADRPGESYFGIKFPDHKSTGNMLRSHMLKIHSSVASKKQKALEQKLEELKLSTISMPSERVVQLYNKLRCDIAYLIELKTSLAVYESDVQNQKVKCRSMNITHLLPPDPDPMPSKANKTVKKQSLSSDEPLQKRLRKNED